MTKERILERAKEIMKRDKVDAEKAWALAVAELTIEEQKAATAKAENEKQLAELVKQGGKVIGELRNLKDKLEDESNDDGQGHSTPKAP